MNFRGLLRQSTGSWIHAASAVILAGAFFSFQIELFDAEWEANHPPVSTSITSPSTTWESFDKDNALKAFALLSASRGAGLLLASPYFPAATRIDPLTRPLSYNSTSTTTKLFTGRVC